MRALPLTLPAFLLGLWSGSPAWAVEGQAIGEGSILLAGEILIGPDRVEGRANGARNQRERAGTYQRGVEPADIPLEDDGILAPRGGSPMEERAFDNRMRARGYQSGTDAPAMVPGMPAGMGEFPMPASSQERARDLRGRARTYTGNGNAQDLDLSQVGADGIPVVPCRGDVDNVAARIGEEGTAGSVFYVMRNNKPVKVRCR